MSLTDNELIALVSQLIPDNNNQEVSPADVRSSLQQMITSACNKFETTEQAFVAGLLAPYVKMDRVNLVPSSTNQLTEVGDIYFDSINERFKTKPNGVNLGLSYDINILAVSTDSIAIPQGEANFIPFSGLSILGMTSGFTLDPVTGAIKNETGRNLTVTGGLSVQEERTGGGGSDRWHLYSQTSTDDQATWVNNTSSGRSFDLSNDSQSYDSILSFLGSWPDGAWVRFVFYGDDNTMSFEPTSFPVAGGGTMTGYSVVWTLRGF